MPQQGKAQARVRGSASNVSGTLQGSGSAQGGGMVQRIGGVAVPAAAGLTRGSGMVQRNGGVAAPAAAAPVAAPDVPQGQAVVSALLWGNILVRSPDMPLEVVVFFHVGVVHA
jgi:hypothetical protein